MGVSWHHVKALIEAHQAGARFENTVTLGRLNLLISPWELTRLLASAGLADRFDQFLSPYPTYAEPLFSLLGATKVESIDASDYESATHIHDLNQPLPEHLKGKFDLVDDGGTLEHVFHFTTGLKNCMELAKVGGHVLINTMANNNLGHGFYQFSPELFYRAFSETNGFVVERMVLFESFDGGQWYEVSDPDAVRQRVELISDRHRIGLWVRARRTALVPIFAAAPQQSDYANIAWKTSQTQQPRPNKFLTPPDPTRTRVRELIEKLSPGLLRWIRSQKMSRRNYGFSFEAQPDLYKRINS